MNELIEKLKNTLRDGQKIIGSWEGGEMAISAVPGAGKSYCLATGAALAIAKHKLHAKKQLLIVTYTRSAAISIKSKINQILKEDLQGILGPQGQSGFIVQTIHGLALNIASRYRELLDFDLQNTTVILPTPSHKIIRNTVENWLNKNEFVYQSLVKGKEKYDEETEKIRRQIVLRTEILPNLAYTAIKEAKSSGLLVKDLEKLAKFFQDEYGLINIASGLYQEYEILRKESNYIDYEDMVLAALKVLENQEVLRRFQEEIFAVFEDEAQDSTPLQGELIKLLASNSFSNNSPINLVRVGDPNQAINSTFTPADPVYFNNFCDQCESKNNLATMDQAGRSNIRIIQAANYLINWFNRQNKNSFREQFIQPVSDNDPQVNANPEAEGNGVEFQITDDIYQEVQLIGERVKKLLKNKPDCSIAILVKENSQGSFLAEELGIIFQEENINIYEVGEIERQTKIPEEMLNLLQFMERPHSSDYLKAALQVLENHKLIRVNDVDSWVTYPENFIYSTKLNFPDESNIKEAILLSRKLLNAKLELPSQDLIAFLGMTLQYEGGELATMQKLSERINQQLAGNNSLKNIINSLEEIVTLKKFDVVEEEKDENKYTKPHQLTIITMHKSKGLDWDYVFIPFLTENILPKSLFSSSKEKFLGDFSLNEVVRNVTRSYVHCQKIASNEISKISSIKDIWLEAQNLKIREEYRLLYVSMTRAKRLLWMSSSKKVPFNWTSFNSDQGDSLSEQKCCPFLLDLKHNFSI